ncbi:MAG: hypothetical protein HOQ03_05610, partial [Thermoleophilia bacterium]|nr:hypothetical protein [Thermoleophilia bacterium]
MESTSTGRLTRATLPAYPGRQFSSTLRQRADVPGGAAGQVLNDYWWGTGVSAPLPPVEIPLCWLSNPVRLRLIKPANVAIVSVSGGASGYAINRNSVQ